MRSVLRRFAVDLPTADQDKYWKTAWADTRAVMRHRVAVVVVALLVAGASEFSSFPNHLHGVVKFVVVLVGAGLGAYLGLWIVLFVPMFALAPHRQRNEARRVAGRAQRKADEANARLQRFQTREERRRQFVVALRQLQGVPEDVGRYVRRRQNQPQGLTAEDEAEVAKTAWETFVAAPASAAASAVQRYGVEFPLGGAADWFEKLDNRPAPKTVEELVSLVDSFYSISESAASTVLWQPAVAVSEQPSHADRLHALYVQGEEIEQRVRSGDLTAHRGITAWKRWSQRVIDDLDDVPDHLYEDLQDRLVNTNIEGLRNSPAGAADWLGQTLRVLAFAERIVRVQETGATDGDAMRIRVINELLRLRREAHRLSAGISGGGDLEQLQREIEAWESDAEWLASNALPPDKAEYLRRGEPRAIPDFLTAEPDIGIPLDLARRFMSQLVVVDTLAAGLRAREWTVLPTFTATEMGEK